MKAYQKLVRDKIPEVIRRSGVRPVTRKLGVREYKLALKDKLLEEVQEFRGALRKDALIEELADIEEVVRAVCAAEGIAPGAVEKCRAEKRRTRGGFAKRTFLESVE